LDKFTIVYSAEKHGDTIYSATKLPFHLKLGWIMINGFFSKKISGCCLQIYTLVFLGGCKKEFGYKAKKKEKKTTIREKRKPKL